VRHDADAAENQLKAAYKKATEPSMRTSRSRITTGVGICEILLPLGDDEAAR
jgi:hypothetical protein